MPKSYLDYFPYHIMDGGVTSQLGRRFLKRCKKEGINNGWAVLYRILERIYAEKGYYLPMDEEQAEMIAEDCYAEIEDVEKAITAAIDVGFFHEGEYTECGVLTSADIQLTYFQGIKAAKRENGFIYSDIMLIEFDEENKEWQPLVTNNKPAQGFPENFQKTPENFQNFPRQNKVKESKSNESKEEQTKSNERILHENVAENPQPYPSKMPIQELAEKLILDKIIPNEFSRMIFKRQRIKDLTEDEVGRALDNYPQLIEDFKNAKLEAGGIRQSDIHAPQSEDIPF